jgi:riboflavin biosynthesis pyrimidine reductase
MSVIATLNIGANSATSLAGSSAGLSTPEDRQRFLALHRRAGAYVLGRNSASSELYTTAKVPVIILSRDAARQPINGQIIINVAQGLQSAMCEIKGEYPAPIVVEAGPTLLTALVSKGCIEEIELSLSPLVGDGDFINDVELLTQFTIISDELINGTRLLHGRYNGDSAYS